MSGAAGASASARGRGPRLAALGVAALVAVTLAIRVQVAAERHGGVLAGVAHLAHYFTILTTALLLLAFAAHGLGLRPADRLLAALVHADATAGLVYYTMLAGLWDPQGLAKLADVSLHLVIPLAATAWYLACAPPGLFRLRDLPRTLIWPLAYFAFAVADNLITGFVAYPFVDARTLGLPRLLTGAAGLTALFVATSAAFVGLTALRDHLRAPRAGA